MFLSSIPTYIFIFYITYYTMYLIRLMDKSRRSIIKETNIELNKLREEPVKTLDEQKQFINIKFPKRDEKKKKIVSDIILPLLQNTIIFLVLFTAYFYIFSALGFVVNWWMMLLGIILITIVLNIILKKFNLEDNDNILKYVK